MTTEIIDLGKEGKIKYTDMTDLSADERLEKLLNRFGQTISDLPEIYEDESRESGVNSAIKWSRKTGGRVLAVENYICHLCDVIDRMETALETAALWADCTACENISAVFEGRCICNDNYITADRLLEGRHLNFDEPLIPVSTD